jgi:phosphopantothenoylcysteine decarboxylase/phosphopantothenate--cysteine ligase
MSKDKILFILTGSIACFKAAEVISLLVKNNYEVQTVVTSSALKFIGKSTLEGLTGRKVLLDLWEDGQAMDHISLQRWADLIIVAPASANFINKISAGIADDLASTLFLAHDFKKPFLIAPAMNSSMLEHPVTQKSLHELSKMNFTILPTESGSLACGEIGFGRLLSPEKIFKFIDNSFKKEAKPKVLITAGGTQEPIDEVRFITNKSTGKTASQLADQLIEDGFQVHFLYGVSSQLPTFQCKKTEFTSFEDLNQKIDSLSQAHDFFAIIHAAAVSDFSVENFYPGKVDSENDLVIKLKRNPKIINGLKEKFPIVIGFKLTSSQDENKNREAIEKLFYASQVDILIHNDVSQTHWKQATHQFNWATPDLKMIEKLDSQEALENKISQYLNERYHHDFST